MTLAYISYILAIENGDVLSFSIAILNNDRVTSLFILFMLLKFHLNIIKHGQLTAKSRNIDVTFAPRAPSPGLCSELPLATWWVPCWNDVNRIE